MTSRKFAIARLLCTFTLIVTCCHAITSFAATSALKAFTAHSGIQFSPDMDLYFIQYARAGVLTVINRQQSLYQLTLKDVNPMTTYFSDRPYRITGQLKTDQFTLQADEKWYKSFSGVFSYFLNNNQHNLNSSVIDILTYQYLPQNNTIICKVKLKQAPDAMDNNYNLQGVILQFDAGFFNNIK